MPSRRIVGLLFMLILVGMIAVTTWASLKQPVWEFGGLKGPDAAWTIATLCDAYAGFITFFVWVWYRERSGLIRGLWFVAIMLLGNMAMSLYVLIALARLPAGAPLESLLLRPRS